MNIYGKDLEKELEEVRVRRRGLWYRILEVLVTVFGIGTFRRAPATVAATVACFLHKILRPSFGNGIFAFVIWLAVGIYATKKYEILSGVPDNKVIVLDEFVGGWLAVILSPPGLFWKLLAVFFFRAFDIFKVSPVSFIEIQLPVGWSTMLDDVAAAVLGAGVVRVIFVAVA